MPEFTGPFNSAQMTYAIGNIERLLLSGEGSFIEALDELQVSSAMECAVLNSVPAVFRFEQNQDYTYLSLLLQILLPFISAKIPPSFPDSTSSHIIELQNGVLRLVNVILNGCRGGLPGSLQSKELCLVVDVIRHALSDRVSEGKYAQSTFLLLDAALILASQRIEGLPDIRIYSTICSSAIKGTSQADTLRCWMDFVLKGAGASAIEIDQVWLEFLDIQLNCLSEKLSELQKGPSNPLLVQATITFLEQIGQYGLSMLLAANSDKTSSTGQIRSKPRRFESFRNALLVRSSTTSPSSPVGQIPSCLPDPQVEICDEPRIYHV